MTQSYLHIYEWISQLNMQNCSSQSKARQFWIALTWPRVKIRRKHENDGQTECCNIYQSLWFQSPGFYSCICIDTTWYVHTSLNTSFKKHVILIYNVEVCVSHNLGVSHTSALRVTGFVFCGLRAEVEETVEHGMRFWWGTRSGQINSSPMTTLCEVWDRAEERV